MLNWLRVRVQRVPDATAGQRRPLTGPERGAARERRDAKSREQRERAAMQLLMSGTVAAATTLAVSESSTRYVGCSWGPFSADVHAG